MKKTIALGIIFIFLIITCSCGSIGGNSAVVGDAITVKDFEIKVEKVTFGTNLDTSSQSEYYLADLGKDAPTKIAGYNKAYAASEGRAYVVVLYSVKNVGKNKTTYYGNNIKILYGDGYSYTDIPYSNEPMINAITRKAVTSISFEPLSNEVLLYTVIEVPEFVVTDTSAPLSVEIFNKSWKVR